MEQCSMMRVIVVDDEPLARNGLITRLAANSDLSVIGEYDNGDAALAGILKQQPDLVMIDIDMPGLSGLDVLAGLDPAHRPMAILVTAYANFALRAFELNVIDYLLKPIHDDRLFESIERARAAYPYRKTGDRDSATPYLKSITVRIGNRLVWVNTKDISWIGADGDYVSLSSSNKSYLLREPIHKLIDKLDPDQFIRVHRSTIVRIDQVAELRNLNNRDALIRLHDGTPLRVSRTYIDALVDGLQRLRQIDVRIRQA
jgi:two-component system LytT family response regulator